MEYEKLQSEGTDKKKILKFHPEMVDFLSDSDENAENDEDARNDEDAEHGKVVDSDSIANEDHLG